MASKMGKQNGDQAQPFSGHEPQRVPLRLYFSQQFFFFFFFNSRIGKDHGVSFSVMEEISGVVCTE